MIGRVLARQRMVCRQREDDRRAGERKHADLGRRIMRGLARKPASSSLAWIASTNWTVETWCSVRSMPGNCRSWKAADEALHQAGIGGGDHVADLEPADFAARRLARRLLRLVGQDAAHRARSSRNRVARLGELKLRLVLRLSRRTLRSFSSFWIWCVNVGGVIADAPRRARSSAPRTTSQNIETSRSSVWAIVCRTAGLCTKIVCHLIRCHLIKQRLHFNDRAA